MSAEKPFTKENLEHYLLELSKEFRKLHGRKMPAEIIIIGGGAVLLKYNFRSSTGDVDAIVRSPSVMQEAINSVGEKYHLPNGWLNTDFKNTASYSSVLIEKSKHYKTFSNILDIRVIDAEYLLAMKLMSGRGYKNDLSDIAGILFEHEKAGNPISLERIQKAAVELYESWEKIPEKSRGMIQELFKNGNYEEEYHANREEEIKRSEVLSEFKEKYPGSLRGQNIDDVIDSFKAKKESEANLNDRP